MSDSFLALNRDLCDDKLSLIQFTFVQSINSEVDHLKSIMNEKIASDDEMDSLKLEYLMGKYQQLSTELSDYH
ncbi:CLUMA_CG002456, isoform A [Clunio marinus]|uniref:CLUMA_CG002456, isoform A n=1 Tax=Clunio marinus TaxID=568069 RepID=A0A1J1HKM2_9DIPT|nr:CLUMA_CG002456, isoform A [Clunio marinus]